ncbi:hypothetical protein NK8_84600 (plasmid) [Caballeronia sp. NK8]|nr:acyl-CoA dehydrogenase C-terminal domain-containing protein [Caballeronia sp. NK8]BCQ30269.1 hypothetical protein NK8_84600 [Caballeronia sp. NK8]
MDARRSRTFVAYVLESGKRDPNAVFAGSVPYLKLAGIVLSGWQMARALLAAQRKRAEDLQFYGAKIATAHCFSEYVLTRGPRTRNRHRQRARRRSAVRIERSAILTRTRVLSLREGGGMTLDNAARRRRRTGSSNTVRVNRWSTTW